MKDTGIGMNKWEVISNLGTIAKSGSEEFLKNIQGAQGDANNIIGRFESDFTLYSW